MHKFKKIRKKLRIFCFFTELFENSLVLQTETKKQEENKMKKIIIATVSLAAVAATIFGVKKFAVKR